MADKTISSLPEVVSPSPIDVVPIVSLGVTSKAQVQNLNDGLPIATVVAKGLMSASDKAALEQAKLDVSGLLSHPVVATVASANAVSIPNGSDVILLTGSTNVTSVVDGVPYHTYTFYHLSGSSLSFLGMTMPVGATIVAVYTP